MKVTQPEDSYEENQIRRLLSSLMKGSKIILQDMTEDIGTNLEGQDNEPKQENYLPSIKAFMAVKEKKPG